MVVKTIIILATAFSLAGCKQGACSYSLEFARGSEMTKAANWIQANIFLKEIPRDQLRYRALAGPGNVAIYRPYLKFSGLVPEKFRQMMIVGDRNNPTGVFLNKGNYIGVLVAKDSVRPIIKYLSLEPHTEIISERLAVVCMPRD